MRHIAILLTACALAACSAERSNMATPPALDTGITSSNGGGTRALNNNPNVGVTTTLPAAK